MVDTISIEEMKKSALEFLTQVSVGDYSGAIAKFDNDLKKALPPEKLQALVQQLTTQAGAMSKVDGVSTSEMQGYTVVAITCQFAKAYMDILIPFNGQGLMSGLSFKPSTPLASEYRPPAYVDLRSFTETAVTVGSGEWALPGTISIPVGKGPFPGVVLVHGSGPNDRDETLGPNKVFRDLAWGLSTLGIAVLRYDKRTMVHKSKYTPDLASKITVKDEAIDDALLAVTLMGGTPKVDPKRLFILGHSLGGMLLPWIGSQATGLAGMIIMAGSSRPLEDSILDQFTYLYSLSGPMSEQQWSDMEKLKAQVDLAKSPGLSENTPRKDLPLGMWPTYILSMRDYKPVDVARSMPMPMLLLQGGRDYQVMPAKDFEAWKAGLQDKANVTFRLFPGLNHMMIEGKGPCRPEEYAIEGHMSEDVVNAIAGWIKDVRT
jgi:hypothetical protein